jgi:ankyrin repeat protein
MFAIRNGHSEVVNKLLDKGANIEAMNKVTYLIS